MDEIGTEKELYSEYYEQQILGSILQDYKAIINICITKKLEPEFFYKKNHQTIYKLLLEMKGGQINEELINLSIFTEYLRRIGRLDEVGGFLFLDEILYRSIKSSVVIYIDDVIDFHRKRNIRNLLKESHDLATVSLDSSAKVTRDIVSRLSSFCEDSTVKEKTWVNKIGSSFCKMENAFNLKCPDYGLLTGFDDLDDLVFGLNRSELIIVGARPSVGKTSFALNIAINIVTDKDPKPVAIFSLEMDAESLATRLICSMAGVSSHKIRSGYVSKDNMEQLTKMKNILEKAPMFVDDRSGLDISEIVSKATQLRRDEGIKLVIVDYLGLIKNKKANKESRQCEISSIAEAFKALAKDLNIPVLVLCQLNREIEGRTGNPKPKLSDLRDSGSIEQAADVVMLLSRPCKSQNDERKDDVRLAYLDVAKNRCGRTGEIELVFEERYTQFLNKGESMPVDGTYQASKQKNSKPPT